MLGDSIAPQFSEYFASLSEYGQIYHGLLLEKDWNPADTGFIEKYHVICSISYDKAVSADDFAKFKSYMKNEVYSELSNRTDWEELNAKANEFRREILGYELKELGSKVIGLYGESDYSLAVLQLRSYTEEGSENILIQAISQGFLHISDQVLIIQSTHLYENEQDLLRLKWEVQDYFHLIRKHN